MPSNKKTDATAAAPTKAKITKDPTVGNIIKKANGQKLVAAPSRFKFIFEDDVLLHLMLLNA